MLVEVFPALFRETAPGSAGEVLLTDSEAGCFFHAQKKAVVVCEACGRFLCALCDVELDGRHLCLGCVEASRKKNQMQGLENRRVLYDSMALGLALGPPLTLALWFFTIFTAPMALYVALRYWKRPTSITGRTQARRILAVLFATAQIVGWVVLVYVLITKMR